MRKSWASTTGTTMYKPTDSNSVFQGTVMADKPSSKATMGANATTMMRSLTATCESVNKGSPLHRLLHTNTMAVQGAAANKMSPAI